MSIHFNHNADSIYKAITDDSGIPLDPMDGTKELLSIFGITEEGMKEMKTSQICERLYLHIKEDKISPACLLTIMKIITDNINNTFQEFEKEITPWYKRVF